MSPPRTFPSNTSGTTSFSFWSGVQCVRSSCNQWQNSKLPRPSQFLAEPQTLLRLQGRPALISVRALQVCAFAVCLEHIGRRRRKRRRNGEGSDSMTSWTIRRGLETSGLDSCVGRSVGATSQDSHVKTTSSRLHTAVPSDVVLQEIVVLLSWDELPIIPIS